MLAMGGCTTKQWQTAGRLVQEFNVCTVPIDMLQHWITRSICVHEWYAMHAIELYTIYQNLRNLYIA